MPADPQYSGESHIFAVTASTTDLSLPYPSSPTPDPDLLDTILTLEDTLYSESLAAGTAAGAHAGRVEGRLFGIERGFEVFTEIGEAWGRAMVWGARVEGQERDGREGDKKQNGLIDDDMEKESAVKSKLPRLQASARLKQNITILHDLTDPLTYSGTNTDDAVEDAEERLKRARAKIRLIERAIGEISPPALGSDKRAGKEGSVSEGAGVAAGGLKIKATLAKGGKKGMDMGFEDFADTRFLR